MRIFPLRGRACVFLQRFPKCSRFFTYQANGSSHLFLLSLLFSLSPIVTTKRHPLYFSACLLLSRCASRGGLVAQLETHPDSTLQAHCQLWESTHGMWVDHTTMSRAIRRVGWRRRKKRWVPLNAMRKSGPPGEQK